MLYAYPLDTESGSILYRQKTTQEKANPSYNPGTSPRCESLEAWDISVP